MYLSEQLQKKWGPILEHYRSWADQGPIQESSNNSLVRK